MARGGFPGMGGGANMQQLMRQAQKMQQDMTNLQEELGAREIETSSGGVAVKVVIYGRKELKSIEIDPDCIDPDDIEMLQDMILAAVNEAIRKADDLMSTEMAKVTGGLGGFNLGF